MPLNQWLGQPGNALPFETDASTNEIKPNYMFQAKMPIHFMSSAQAVQLETSQAGLIVYGGASSGSTATLPRPEPGLVFTFFADGPATSAALVIRTNSSLVDMVIGQGNVGSTNTAVGLVTTAAQLGSACQFIGLSTARWAFIGLSAQLSSAKSTDDASTLAALWEATDSTG